VGVEFWLNLSDIVVCACVCVSVHLAGMEPDMLAIAARAAHGVGHIAAAPGRMQRLQARMMRFARLGRKSKARSSESLLQAVCVCVGVCVCVWVCLCGFVCAP
jgi:hypothetical protein